MKDKKDIVRYLISEKNDGTNSQFLFLGKLRMIRKDKIIYIASDDQWYKIYDL